MTPERNYGPGMISKFFSYWREMTIVGLLIFSVSCIDKLKKAEEPVKEGLKVNEQVEFIEHNWTGFDSLSFDEAFAQMYTEYGPGHVFDWRGNVFLTKLEE